MIIAIADLAAAAGGEIIRPRSDAGGERRDGRGPDVVRGASIDSRSLTHGELFVAVPAERDGHDFVAAAARLGAAAALVSRPVDADIVQIVVDDTVAALGAMGGLARERLDGPVVGITGSVGKTSTKDLLASICALAGVTTASEKSLNNEMGVPLTLLNADVETVKAAAKRSSRPKASKGKDAPSHLTADSRGVILEDEEGSPSSTVDASGVVKKRFIVRHK